MVICSIAIFALVVNTSLAAAQSLIQCSSSKDPIDSLVGLGPSSEAANHCKEDDVVGVDLTNPA